MTIKHDLISETLTYHTIWCMKDELLIYVELSNNGVMCFAQNRVMIFTNS